MDEGYSGVGQDRNSEIYKEFLSRASRACALLRKLSDGGKEIWPIHIMEVQEAIVKELGEVYFLGIGEDK